MKRLLLWLAAAFGPAVVGAPFAGPRYYSQLRKPSWAPPPGVFGPAWTVLYLLMGIAAWRLDVRGGPAARPGLRLWGVQLLLNAAWTPIFFGLRAPGLALVEIVAMWIAVAATTAVFLRRHLAAGLLMLPYLAWVTFAAVLNYAVWRRNR